MSFTKRRLFVLLLTPLFSLAAGCLTPQAGHDRELSARFNETLSRLEDSGATFTARVLELPHRRELYARDIDVPYIPASNMKIVVSAAGLDMFGAGHTFKTYLALDGDDLWVIGTGDPGIGDPRLARRQGSIPIGVFDDWAAALQERGVTHITGDLFYYDGALDDEWIHPSWDTEDLLHWYATPTSGLNFNDNCVDITIHPTEPDQPVRYEVMPPVRHIEVINECVTGTEHEPTIEKLPDGNVYKLGGTCAERAELKSKPVENPGEFFCDALRTHLESCGITITGQTKRAPAPLRGWTSVEFVATHETNMPDVLGRINTNSQNFFAEALCKLTGRAYAFRAGRDVPGSWPGGDRAIRDFLRRHAVDDRHMVVADGSGLSDVNRVTSRMLTDLFAAMYDRADAEVFIDSLAKGGVNGTLEKRFAGLEGHVFAKTGYISGVRALSGYVRTYEGDWLTFSIIYNHIPGSVKPYEALQDEAVRLLVNWPNLDQVPTKQPAEAASAN